MGKKIFKEKQRFRSIDIIAMVIFFIVIISYKLITEIITWDGNYINEIICVILLALFGGILYYLLKMRIKVSVDEENIKFKMTPWHAQTQKINWKNIQSCKIVRTPISAQWHGGNISFRHEKRFSLSGRNGIHLVTKDGKEYFIGSRRIDELKNAIEKVFK